MKGTLWMRNALRMVILLLEALNFNVLWATFILAVSFSLLWTVQKVPLFAVKS